MEVRRAVLAFAATIIAGSSTVIAADPASASSTLVVTSDSVVYPGPSPITAALQLTSPARSYSSVYVSPQYLNGTLDGKGVQLFAYCVDILHYSGPGSFNVVSLLDYLGGNTTKYDRLAALIAAAGGPANADSDAATQAAAWEIMYDTTYDLGSGNFAISNIHNDSDLITDANSLLTQAVANAGKAGSNLNLFVAVNRDKQDMLFWTTSPVPEPATWAMMLLGYGVIGFAMRRRKLGAALKSACLSPLPDRQEPCSMTG